MVYILMAMADHEGGSPVLAISAGSREEALKKIGATNRAGPYVEGSLTFSEETPEEVRANKEVKMADWCELQEVPSL